MTHAAPLQMTPAVPAHLVGTRAALFFLWGSEAARPLPVEAPRPLPQASGLDRVRAALQSDVFVFTRRA
jgi:hypothetical protein